MQITAKPRANPKTWRLVELLGATVDYFEKKGIESARLNAEMLLARALGMERIALYLNHDRPIEPEELRHFRTLIQRRANREPLQYILGETEFMSLTFAVDETVLIPRQDTEALVEWVIEDFAGKDAARPGQRAAAVHEPSHEAASDPRVDSDSTRASEALPLAILDIGTGSGNIAISLAHNLPQAKVMAVDVSPGAISLASKNAARHNLDDRITFVIADVMDFQFGNELGGQFDVIVANPPYIDRDDLASLEPEVNQFEPEIALLDPAGSGSFFARIAACAPKILKKGGTLYVEIGVGQGQKVREIFEQGGLADIKIREDYAGIERVVRASIVRTGES